MQVLCLSPIFRQSTSRQTSESAYRDSVRRFVAPPEKRPGGVNARILLAWVAYKSEQNAKNGGKAEQEASLLHVQQMLRFSTENQASAVLKRLRTSASPSEGPWLAVSTPSRGARGHAYRLGAAATASAPDWAACGKCLYSPSGLLTPYMFRPVLLRPPLGQGITGCLVIGFVDQFGPVTKTEIVGALSSLMRRETALKALRRAVAMELLVLEDDHVIAPRNLRERIKNDEIEFGGQSRAAFLDQQIGSRQFESQMERLGGATLERLKAIIRKLPCFYCATAAPPEGGEVEHFPPKHWGGGDDASLLLPICTRCNKSHGSRLKGTPKISRPVVTAERIPFDGETEDFGPWFFEFFLMRAVHYAHALNEKRLDDARDAALRFFPTLIALKRGIPVVAVPSGEITTAALSDDLSVTSGAVGALEGLPRLLRR